MLDKDLFNWKRVEQDKHWYSRHRYGGLGMCNTFKYPQYRSTCIYSCVICFDDSYSWTVLSESQRQYLLSSDYLEKCVRVDVRMIDYYLVSFTKDEFVVWLKNENDRDEIERRFCLQ